MEVHWTSTVLASDLDIVRSDHEVSAGNRAVRNETCSIPTLLQS